MNGNSPTNIPDDIVWDADDPPIVYACTQYTLHNSECDGDCDYQVATEALVKMMNEGFAFRRAGMSYRGVVAAYSGVIPVSGIPVEVFDILLMVEVLRDIVVEHLDISVDELHEAFREHKFNFMSNVREQAEEQIRKTRIQRHLGIQDRPTLFGPDGEPIG